MPNTVKVKICGLKDAEGVRAALSAGADYIGFNFYPRSPRFVNAEVAPDLAALVPAGVAKVGLVVDYDDEILDGLLASVPLDMIQLHGDETPQRVTEIKTRFGLPVIKALGVSSQGDLAKVAAYADVADQLLIDAAPPKDAVLPGGNGIAFDWSILTGQQWPLPWLLAGGLTVQNVGRAVAQTGATQVDVSSGVETAPGVKGPKMMADFIRAAQPA